MNSANSIRTIRMLVENHYGALLKIERFFTTRGYSTAALHVVQGEEMRQITIAVRCDELRTTPKTIEQNCGCRGSDSWDSE